MTLIYSYFDFFKEKEQMGSKGKLILIPVPISDAGLSDISTRLIDTVHGLDVFFAEKSKTARYWIKAFQHPKPQNQLTVIELDKHLGLDNQVLSKFWDQGIDVGFMSESGLPCIADPGKELVALAHSLQIEVLPLSGPSSIFLALMASGFNGQYFSFNGYLPQPEDQLAKEIKQHYSKVMQSGQTQIFIETPYRSKRLFLMFLKCLPDTAKLSIHIDLTSPAAYSKTFSIKGWKGKNFDGEFFKRPAIFLLGL